MALCIGSMLLAWWSVRVLILNFLEVDTSSFVYFFNPIFDVLSTFTLRRNGTSLCFVLQDYMFMSKLQ